MRAHHVKVDRDYMDINRPALAVSVKALSVHEPFLAHIRVSRHRRRRPVTGTTGSADLWCYPAANYSAFESREEKKKKKKFKNEQLRILNKYLNEHTCFIINLLIRDHYTH